MNTRLLALLLAAVPLTAPAGANPLPDAWAFAHVQSGTAIIGTCEEVTRFTSATGVLTFDLYLWPVGPFHFHEELGLGAASTEFEWPAYWEFVEASLPQGVAGEITSLEPNRYSIDVTWPSCPTQTQEQPLFHVARFMLNVTAEGECRVRPVSCQWELCHPEPYPYGNGADGVPTTAGSPCSDCPWPCGEYPAFMSYREESLELRGEEGRSVTGELNVAFDTSGGHTNPVFDATEPYLTVEATPLDPSDYLLEVTADASGLATGKYLGHVRTISQGCTWCCPVNLTVLPSSPVQSTTWGRIKTICDE